MRIPMTLLGLLAAGLPLGGCASYDLLPSTEKVPQPVLNRPGQLDMIKGLRETSQTHGADAAKKIEDAR